MLNVVKTLLISLSRVYFMVMCILAGGVGVIVVLGLIDLLLHRVDLWRIVVGSFIVGIPFGIYIYNWYCKFGRQTKGRLRSTYRWLTDLTDSRSAQK